MKTLLTIISISLLCITQAFSQDKLMFLDGNEEDVKITEVSSSEVKYKRMNNLEGPTFSTLKSELFMIKYANGTKEVVEHTAAAPAPTPTPTPTPTAEPPVAQRPDNNTQQQNTSGLSSAVTITNEPANQGYAKPQTDRYGRTRDENLRLRRKRIVGGAVSMGIGGATLITGAIFLGQGLRYDNLYSNSLTYADHPARNYTTVGGVLMTAGFVVTMIGVGLLSTSRKYKKRAAELANSRFDMNPTLLNDFEYAGANVKSNSGVGFRLTYDF